MKVAIKHNLSLLISRSPHPAVHMSYFLFLLFGRFNDTLFMLAIPTITSIAMLAIETFDENKLKNLFSFPITKKEFAQAKFLTLLIVYVGTIVIALIIYTTYVMLGFIDNIDFLRLIIELLITFPLSILFGGIIIYFSGVIPIVLVFIINIVIVAMNIKLQIGQKMTLNSLTLMIWLVLSIISCVVIRKSIFSKYSKMEV